MNALTRRLNWVLIAAFATAGVGCGKDQEKCNEAVETARKAMQPEFLDMPSAREWREHAGKLCGAGAEVAALDKEIVAKEAEIVKTAEDNAKQEAANGKKAMLASAKLWKKFDKLEDDDRDQKALKSYWSKAKKLTKKGLTSDYKKQVDKYNSDQYKSRKKQLED